MYRMGPNDISYVHDGTYAREGDGACHLYHSPFKFNNGAAALRNRDARDQWRQVTAGSELASVRNLLNANLRPGEYVEV